MNNISEWDRKKIVTTHKYNEWKQRGKEAREKEQTLRKKRKNAEKTNNTSAIKKFNNQLKKQKERINRIDKEIEKAAENRRKAYVGKPELNPKPFVSHKDKVTVQHDPVTSKTKNIIPHAVLAASAVAVGVIATRKLYKKYKIWKQRKASAKTTLAKKHAEQEMAKLKAKLNDLRRKKNEK